MLVDETVPRSAARGPTDIIPSSIYGHTASEHREEYLRYEHKMDMVI